MTTKEMSTAAFVSLLVIGSLLLIGMSATSVVAGNWTEDVTYAGNPADNWNQIGGGHVGYQGNPLDPWSSGVGCVDPTACLPQV